MFPPLFHISVLVHTETALITGVPLPVSSGSSVTIPGLTFGEDGDGYGGDTRVFWTLTTTIRSAVIHNVDLVKVKFAIDQH